MKNLYNALNLKKLLTLKEFGFEYIEPIEEFNDTPIELPDKLTSLQQIANQCHLCELSKSRTNIVFGKGNINADLMLIGDAPNNVEDTASTPFLGRSGELLTKIIENVLHISRDEVYITNIIKCMPLNNRKVTSKEILSCKPYLQKEIEIVKPKLIVALGEEAYNYLTNNNQAIVKTRGSIIDMQEYKLIATFHPNYLLRNPSAKKDVFEDFLKIKEFLAL